jgi:hypothetical protein
VLKPCPPSTLGLAQTSTTESLWSISQTISPPMSTVKLVWTIATTTTTGT